MGLGVRVPTGPMPPTPAPPSSPQAGRKKKQAGWVGRAGNSAGYDPVPHPGLQAPRAPGADGISLMGRRRRKRGLWRKPRPLSNPAPSPHTCPIITVTIHSSGFLPPHHIASLGVGPFWDERMSRKEKMSHLIFPLSSPTSESSLFLKKKAQPREGE